MKINLYILLSFIAVLSTISVFATSGEDLLMAPSSTIDRDDIIINNSHIITFNIEDTDSMLPTFDSNNVVYGVPIDNNTELNIGDIVVYETDHLIIHRIIGITTEGYLLKGDNNEYSDGIIPFENIKYKAVGVVF